MLICDTHCDTLFALATRPGQKTDVTWDRLQKAGISLQTMALYEGDTTDMNELLHLNRQMLNVLEKMKSSGWQQADDPRDAKDSETRFLLSLEGCTILGEDVEQVAFWRGLGVRIAALTWNHENKLAFPAKNDTGRGLTPAGKKMSLEMNRQGIALDTSHLNEHGFWDLLELGLVPMASHSCCKALCPHARNLTDEQLRALFHAGGYVGMNFYPYFIAENGSATLDDVCDHIIHMMELGGEHCVGLGSDFDGIELKVPGLDNPLDVPSLLEHLKARGLSEAEVQGVAGRNLTEYFDRIFPRTQEVK